MVCKKGTLWLLPIAVCEFMSRYGLASTSHIYPLVWDILRHLIPWMDDQIRVDVELV